MVHLPKNLVSLSISQPGEAIIQANLAIAKSPSLPESPTKILGPKFVAVQMTVVDCSYFFRLFSQSSIDIVVWYMCRISESECSSTSDRPLPNNVDFFQIVATFRW